MLSITIIAAGLSYLMSIIIDFTATIVVRGGSRSKNIFYGKVF